MKMVTCWHPKDKEFSAFTDGYLFTAPDEIFTISVGCDFNVMDHYRLMHFSSFVRSFSQFALSDFTSPGFFSLFTVTSFCYHHAFHLTTLEFE